MSLRDRNINTNIGNVNIYPTEGNYWVTYTSQNLFDSYG